jgi:hypothetical protein
MSTYTEKVNRTATWPMFAMVGASTAVVLTAVGTFWDLTDNQESGSNDGIGGYLGLVGFIVVATAIVFGLVVRTAAGSGAGTRALVLAIIGLLSTAVFWSGLPAVLAAGSVACALVAREELGRTPGTAKTALGISAVTIALAVYAAIAG